MKKTIFKVKNNINSQKKLYLLLIGLAIFSLISGIIFIFLISEENVSQITNNLTSFFSTINNQDKFSLFLNSFINNSIYILIIWILGMSIIGLPIVLFILLFKFFLFGFSLSSIIFTFKWKGVLMGIIQLVPHGLILLVIMLLISFYAISFCIKLFNYLFLRKIINFKDVMRKYLVILLITFCTNILVSLYEAYISTYLLSLLN